MLFRSPASGKIKCFVNTTLKQEMKLFLLCTLWWDPSFSVMCQERRDKLQKFEGWIASAFVSSFNSFFKNIFPDCQSTLKMRSWSIKKQGAWPCMIEFLSNVIYSKCIRAKSSPDVTVMYWSAGREMILQITHKAFLLESGGELKSSNTSRSEQSEIESHI